MQNTYDEHQDAADRADRGVPYDDPTPGLQLGWGQAARFLGLLMLACGLFGLIIFCLLVLATWIVS